MKKFEITTIDAVHKVYIVEAEYLEEAIDAIKDGESLPIASETIFTQVEEVKEIEYVN